MKHEDDFNVDLGALQPIHQRELTGLVEVVQTSALVDALAGEFEFRGTLLGGDSPTMDGPSFSAVVVARLRAIAAEIRREGM